MSDPVTDQYQYVKMPDGSYGKFSANATDEQIRGQIQKDFPDAFKQEQPQEGFLHSIGSQFGLTPEAGEARRQELLHHPVKTILKNLVDPGGVGEGTVRGVADYGKRLFSDAYDAGQSLAAHNPAQAGVDAIDAIPILGPAELKAADQYGEGNIGGAAGTVMGAAPQAALAIEGGVKAFGAEPHFIPSRARAGETFNSLNTDLAKTEVPLKASLQPLQRATEIGGRGSTLPKPISDLLTRSQAIEPMTFPEARDYQGALSDLSASDKLALNGRMRGALAQLNKGLYEDIRTAAGDRGPDFDVAMKEYRRASTLKGLIQTAKPYAIKGAAGAAGAGIAYPFAKKIFEQFR